MDECVGSVNERTPEIPKILTDFPNYSLTLLSVWACSRALGGSVGTPALCLDPAPWHPGPLGSSELVYL